MQIVEEFNLNYPYATLAECFVSRLGFKIFILLLVIKFYYRFFFFDRLLSQLFCGTDLHALCIGKRTITKIQILRIYH